MNAHLCRTGNYFTLIEVDIFQLNGNDPRIPFVFVAKIGHEGFYFIFVVEERRVRFTQCKQGDIGVGLHRVIDLPIFSLGVDLPYFYEVVTSDLYPMGCNS